MVFVAVAEPAKRSRIVADDHCVHALGNGDLPGIVLTHALGGTTLAQGSPLRVLVSDDLPTKRAKHLAHRGSIRCAFQHLREVTGEIQSSAPGLRAAQARAGPRRFAAISLRRSMTNDESRRNRLIYAA